MTVTAVSRCAQCEAVVNVYWPSCLVCRATLPPVPKAPTPSGLTPDHQRRAGEPLAPILPGWRVTYRDKAGQLCGGAEDRARGTVLECRWESGQWIVSLTDGQRLPLWIIRAVGRTDQVGRILAAWTVREHGYDGNGPVRGL
jgi:hypothetical protein